MARTNGIAWICVVGVFVGCPDTGIDPQPGEGEDDPGDDDTVDGDDDSTHTDERCADIEWPTVELPVDESCRTAPGEALWDIEITRTFDGETGCGPLHVGRMADRNGDGVIDELDSMQLWSHDSAHTPAELITHDGVLLASILHEARSISASIGDVDPSLPGMEFVVSFDPEWDDEFDRLAMWDASGQGPYWSVEIPENSVVRPWLTDLDGDGDIEVLHAQSVFDGLTGAHLATLDGLVADDTGPPVAADLDLDGTQEIITTSLYDEQHLGLYAPDGTLRATCWTGTFPWVSPFFAIANFDADPEGEFVATLNRRIAIFDADCAEIAGAEFGASNPLMVAVGELDGDPSPEIVLGYGPEGVVVLESDLSLKWHWNHADPLVQHHPLTLADLDADGVHEILVSTHPELVVLSGEGDEIVTVPAWECNCASAHGAPVVADVDADGLAEIVVPGWPTFAVLENPYGGWLLQGADEPWTGIEKFPGSRTPHGVVPGPATRPWQDPHTNIWQALPVGSPSVVPQPDLVLGDMDVCVDEGSAFALLTVYLGNLGTLDVHTAISVRVHDHTGEGLLDDAIVVELPIAAGVSRPVQFTVPVGELSAGVTVTADALNAVVECDESNNSLDWAE